MNKHFGESILIFEPLRLKIKQISYFFISTKSILIIDKPKFKSVFYEDQWQPICKFFLLASLLVVSFTAGAQVDTTPTYQLYIGHDSLINSKTLQLDVYLIQTGTTPFYLSGLDMGIGFDTSIVNGGTLSATYVSGFSDLQDGEASGNSQVECWYYSFYRWFF